MLVSWPDWSTKMDQKQPSRIKTTQVDQKQPKRINANQKQPKRINVDQNNQSESKWT
jgi:hypothetical protein